MQIAVDAMGGDHAPGEIVRGAVAAAREKIADIILVGDKRRLEPELNPLHPPANLEIVHTEQVVAMDEQPALALRRKREASIIVATRLVKEGRAAAVVSAGSTGAQMAAALLILGRSGKIQRPAIATIIPTLKGPKLLLDAGANVDCRPEHLYEFALMGNVYAARVMGIREPRVGLLNIGTEACKGNEQTLGAYNLLKDAPLNFIGNIEGRDILAGDTDVIVCDGFVGNVLLKFGEGMAQVLFTMIGREIKNSFRARLGAALVLPALRGLKKQVDYTEYGGAPLLGVQGVSIICHGSSNARAIKNAIKVAVRCVEQGLVTGLGQLPGLSGDGEVVKCQPY
ncbi:phosphate acyltransferase [Moorella sp. E308F]|uniref:phosphate acyltransferase PlsX n=1 Tax=unclassified Neomoorella TaxID=2676739 RepID=UPI0010FFAD38|nr:MULTISPECIES: phosphate acyltransferase PlsX [unclassified Moorella (in: firmicutes)]GEA15123.1 phosphate acyltransferase [Moorella sp. E308F]GEA16966.1 phosphate acyltransferase [Moorella sp. E306M]